MNDFSSFVSELKQRADIVQVIGNYVHLKKMGGRYMGLCPFHGDRNPSMTVSPQIGIFKCFSCGQGGDVIQFVQNYEKIEFMDAIRQLSEIVGVELPQFKSLKKSSVDHRKIYLELYAKSSIYYKQQLKKHPKAEKYLGDRKISAQIIEKFGLGFSTDLWKGLIDYLKGQGYETDKIISSGLAKKNERGERDTFVGRLMFPIYNLSHQVVGFGGRILDVKEKTAKYINSAESILYQKSSILYGLNFSRKAIQVSNEVVVVEGYMDMLRLFQEGIENVVSISGTALTEEQVKILSRFAGLVYLFFDGDKAGLNAIEKSLPILLKQGIEVRIPNLPIDEDPDSFALKNGGEALKKLFLKSDNVLDFLLRDFKKNSFTYTNEKKGKLFEKVKWIFNFIQSDFVRREYLNDLAKIEKEFFTQGSEIFSIKPRITKTKVSPNSDLSSQKILKQVSQKMRNSPEWKLLPFILSSNTLLEQLFDRENFDTDWIEDLFLRELLERIMVECERIETVNLMMAFDKLPSKFKEVIYTIELLELNSEEDLTLAKKSLFQIIIYMQILFLKKELSRFDLEKSQKILKLEEWKKVRLEAQTQLKNLILKRNNIN